jgi:hypothetical protein
MIRLFYWLIKRRWAICDECKYHEYEGIEINGKSYDGCKAKLLRYEFDYVKGVQPEPRLSLCDFNNIHGICWKFKPKGNYIEPSEPWPRR